MLWLLFISSCNFVQLLFESGYYMRAAFIRLRTKMKKSTASRRAKWLQTPVSQCEERLPHLPLQWIPSSRNQTPSQMLKDEDELEKKDLALKDC